jgi:hypothetical protein
MFFENMFHPGPAMEGGRPGKKYPAVPRPSGLGLPTNHKLFFKKQKEKKYESQT